MDERRDNLWTSAVGRFESIMAIRGTTDLQTNKINRIHSKYSQRESFTLKEAKRLKDIYHNNQENLEKEAIELAAAMRIIKDMIAVQTELDAGRPMNKTSRSSKTQTGRN